MKYQLVLQWPTTAMDFDALIEIEDLLIESLSAECDVDGHDAAPDQMNIFIFTDDPVKAFEEVKRLLENHSSWCDIRVAYRDFRASDFFVVWPKGLTEFVVS